VKKAAAQILSRARLMRDLNIPEIDLEIWHVIWLAPRAFTKVFTFGDCLSRGWRLFACHRTFGRRAGGTWGAAKRYPK
jgi:hypothetical protein